MDPQKRFRVPLAAPAHHRLAFQALLYRPAGGGWRGGGGVAAACASVFPWAGGGVSAVLAPPASLAHRGQRPPATGATVSTTLSQKKRNSRESAQDRCRRCRKSGAWLLSVRRRCCACPPGSACSSVRCRCHRSGACLLCVRWRCRGLPPVPVLSLCCPPSSPAALLAVVVVSACAVSACCPVLPEAVVGASRATRGRLASTQGCYRCPCPSRWARLLALCTVAVAAFPARSASTQRGHRPRQRKQRSSATLSKKRKHRRSLRRPVAAVAVRLPVLSAVRLLLRSCGVSLPPLPCGCRCCRCSRRSACCCVAAACRCCRCRAAPGAAVALGGPPAAA